MTRHNELHNGVADLASKAFMPSHVRGSPLFYKGCSMQVVMNHKYVKKWGSPATPNNPPLVLEDSEKKGESLIRDL